MAIDVHNEVTLEIIGNPKKFAKDLEEKGFIKKEEYILEDIYMIPKDANRNRTEREILREAVLIRKVNYGINGTSIRLCFKRKEIDEKGNIQSQKIYNCNISSDVEDGKKFMEAIGYEELMYLYEKGTIYQKEGLELCIKEIKEGDNLIEIETGRSEKFNTIEKIIEEVKKLKLPVDTTEFFVKKAERQLKRMRENKYERK